MDPSKLSLTLRRRDFLRQAGGGIGMIALANLLAEEGRTADAPSQANPFVLKPPHFPAKAKNVIWLFMNGGPSHVDTWDYKPELEKRQGTDLPESIRGGRRAKTGRPGESLPKRLWAARTGSNTSALM